MTITRCLLALLLACCAAGCGSSTAVADGATSSDAPKDMAPADSGGGGEAGPQCCAVTLGGPGTEDCPCSPYHPSSPGACHDVGRTCRYDGCFEVVSCECLATDGGAAVWSCQVLLR